MSKVVTFGEIMLRLTPENYNRFFQNDTMKATFGGGEANVAVSLSNFGIDSSFVTKLPLNPIGDGAVNSLRYFGVDTSKIVRGGERVGIYYLEKGASQRGSSCIYDRKYSAIYMAKREDFDWREILKGCEWFHFTGITPALNSKVAEICEDALIEAKKQNITVSCDLNYRGKLWDRKTANETMTRLSKYVDVCIANEEDAKDVFNIESINTDIEGGKLNAKGYESVAKQLANKLHFKKVAITLRISITANDNKWSAMLYDGKKSYFAKTYDLHIVDRVGGGDSFGAGLIYSLIKGKSPQDAIEFATAASALKHSIEGDFNRVTVKEIENLVNSNGTGRIVR